jgi:hypothetical protein
MTALTANTSMAVMCGQLEVVEIHTKRIRVIRKYLHPKIT